MNESSRTFRKGEAIVVIAKQIKIENIDKIYHRAKLNKDKNLLQRKGKYK